MRKLSTLILGLVICLQSEAQFVVGATATLATAADTEITIQTSGAVINNSTYDFSTAKLRLELIGVAQNLTGNFVLRDLSLKADGIKNVNGNLTVTDNIFFTNGILVPSLTGKITFTGAAAGLTTANESSYVDGIFYNNGSNPRAFPIGNAGVFAPTGLGNATGEVGMKVTNSSAGLIIDNVELIGINTDRYWEITTDLTNIDSRIALSLNGLDAFEALDGGTTVVQSSILNGNATNLGSSTSNNNFIESQLKVSAPIITLGKETKVVLKIHDLITPFGSVDKNDKLFIENIHRFDFNTVTLLDRWGVQVARWENYNNDTTNYDFGKLSPGNYICIVQYGKTGGEKKVEQQMVTVLKTN